MKRKPDSPARYLAVFIGALATIAVAFTVLLVLNARQPADTGSSHIFKHIYFFREVKLQAAARMHAPRIVQIGGSSGMYGVNSEVVTAVCGYPYLNYSLNAGLSIDYLLHDARRVLRPGDTALLMFEYEHQYLPDGQRALPQADFVLHHEPSYLLKIPPGRALELMGKLTLPDWAHLLRRGVYCTSLDPAPFTTNLSPYGDALSNTRTNAIKFRAELDAIRAVNLSPGRVSPYAESRLREFVDWCRAHRVSVLATFPPFMEFPEYQTGDFPRLVDSIRDCYAHLGVRVVGDPYGHMFPRSRGFDNRYHMHADSAHEFSLRFAEELLSALDGYDATPEEGADFAKPGLPHFIRSVHGLASTRDGGRRNTGAVVTVRFNRDFSGQVEIALTGRPCEPGLPAQLTINLGGTTRRLVIPADGSPYAPIRFDDCGPASELVIRIESNEGFSQAVNFTRLSVHPGPEMPER